MASYSVVLASYSLEVASRSPEVGPSLPLLSKVENVVGIGNLVMMGTETMGAGLEGGVVGLPSVLSGGESDSDSDDGAG